MQVLGIGHLAAAVRVELRAPGAGRADFENDSSEALLIACSDFPNPASFRDANARSLAGGVPVLFAALTPGALRLGPVVEPGRAGCFECVAPRVHRLVEAAGHALRREPDPIRGARIGATLIVQAIAGAATPYRGSCVAGERRTGAAGCPACLARAARMRGAAVAG